LPAPAGADSSRHRARVEAGVEAGEQPGPRDQVGAGPGHEQLGRQQGKAGGVGDAPGQRGGDQRQPLGGEVLGLA
jgi:hypothetical protein